MDMRKSYVEFVYGFLNIKAIMKSSPCSEGVFMDTIEKLENLERELLQIAELDPDDMIWKQRWIEGSMAIRQKIKMLKGE